MKAGDGCKKKGKPGLVRFHTSSGSTLLGDVDEGSRVVIHVDDCKKLSKVPFAKKQKRRAFRFCDKQEQERLAFSQNWNRREIYFSALAARSSRNLRILRWAHSV